MTSESAIIEANRIFHKFQAEHYDETHDVAPIEDILIRESCVDIPADDILDIGAGTCAIADLLDKNIVSIDLSREMLSHGRGPRAIAAAGTLPFPTNSFQVVTARSVLHHLPDIEAAIAEFKRVCKPDGVLLVLHEPAEGQSRIWHQIIKLKARLARRFGWDSGWRTRAAEQAGTPSGHHLTTLANYHASRGVSRQPLVTRTTPVINVEYTHNGDALWSYLGTNTVDEE